jgi:pimeloyl-ACP methyl ester carboxylesterase/DNA-binding CsgD family transcriptional regulator
VLVIASCWLSHLQFDWESPVWRHFLADIGRFATIVRYDERGHGLSDWDVTEFGLEARIGDLEAVIDHAGLDRFALMGMAQGGPVTIAYAARHPERVSHLVLTGAYARGTLRRNPSSVEQARFFAIVKLIELGWGQDHLGLLHMMTAQLFPNASLEQMRSFNDLQRLTATPAQAARMVMALGESDVSTMLGDVRVPTLVMHARDEVRVPPEEARFIAASIPDARLVLVDSANHLPLPGEPAFDAMFRELDAFLPCSQSPSSAGTVFAALTPREREILELIARGMDNAQIAAWHELSEKTVRNNVSRIFDKLGVEHRGQAIVVARQAGLGQ